MVYYNRHFFQQSGDTGRTFEMDYLYPPNDSRRRIVDNIKFDSIKYRSLFESILASIEDNPARYEGNELWDPPAGWLRDVHYAIVEELNIDDWSRLIVMPTLKTAADKYHGIDFLVIYREPETEREVIVSVDLSLQRKSEFKADVLVTDIGAIPNEYYYFTAPEEVLDVEHATKDEDEMIRQDRRKAIGRVIARIIDEKLKKEDPHYGDGVRQISDKLQRDIDELLEHNTA